MQIIYLFSLLLAFLSLVPWAMFQFLGLFAIDWPRYELYAYRAMWLYPIYLIALSKFGSRFGARSQFGVAIACSVVAVAPVAAFLLAIFWRRLVH